MTGRRRYLTNRSMAALGVAQLVGILSISYPSLLLLYLSGMVVGALAIFGDYKSLPGRDKRSLDAKAELSANAELGANLQLKVEFIRDRHFGAGELSFYAPNIRGLHFGSTSARVSESASGWIGRLEAQAVELGYFELDRLSCSVRSAQGFWLEKFDLEIPPIAFRVSPPLAAVSEQSFQEMARSQRLLYQGSRQVLRGQSADQFYSIRKYQFPDSIRHIDQKKSAKYQQLMTRTYESIFNHHLVIALDLGRSLCGNIGKSKSHDYYLSVCLALARHALVSHDLVSFIGFSDRLHAKISSTRSYAAFAPLLRGDEVLKPREVESNYELLARALPEIAAQRSIVIVLSDTSKPSVQSGLLKSLLPISQKHLTLVLGLIDSSRDLSSRMMSYGGEDLSRQDYAQTFYAYWLEEQASLFAARVSRLGAAAFSLPEACWMSASVKVYDLLRSSMRA